jgi:hypothetical protein
MLKKCSWCQRPKPVAEFGRHARRYDQLNCYCKQCIRERQGKRRAILKVRGKLPKVPPVELTPAVVAPLILEAIDQAPAPPTQKELVQYTERHLPRLRGRPRADDVIETMCLALGELFAERAIATRGSEEQRIYFRR